MKRNQEHSRGRLCHTPWPPPLRVVKPAAWAGLICIAAGFVACLVAALSGCATPPINANVPVASPQTHQAMSQPASSQPVAQQDAAAAAVAAVNAPKATSVGQQAGGGGWTINVGTVEVGGSTAALATLALAAAFLIRRGRAYKKISDLLIRDNETAGITDENKKSIELKAATAGVGGILNRRLAAVRKKLRVARAG